MEDFDPTDHDQQDQQQSQRQQAAERQELARQQSESDFKWLMSDPRGRRFVWAQLSAAGIFLQSFHPDAMQMAFNEGRRSDGLRLLTLVMQLCPDHYATMMKEQTE